MKRSFSFLLLLLSLSSVSCRKKDNSTLNSTPLVNPAYDLVKGSLTVPPFDTSDVTALVPLGNLNPPGHTFPTDHMYFYCFTNVASLNIKAPGNIHIVRIGRTHYNAGTATDHYDYNIAMGSDSSFMYWGHVSNLSPRLLQAVNNFASAICQAPYSTGGGTYEQCSLDVSLSATAGEVLGIANAKNGLAGIDLGVTVNHAGADPLDYFDAKARAMMEPKLGRFDGKKKRTVLPLSGEFNLDVAGTAQGNWIKQGFHKNPEDNNIALVKDNIDPTQWVLSVGNSLPDLASNVYYFDTQNSGLINRKFTDITADGNTYCYTLGVPNNFVGITVLTGVSVIIKLENATTLSAEKRNCDCSCTPYTFGMNKITYTK